MAELVAYPDRLVPLLVFAGFFLSFLLVTVAGDAVSIIPWQYLCGLPPLRLVGVGRVAFWSYRFRCWPGSLFGLSLEVLSGWSVCVVASGAARVACMSFLFW